jgi:hypothetical protein
MAAHYRIVLADRQGNEFGEMPSVGSGVQYADVVNGGGSAAITPALDLPLFSGEFRDRLDSWASEVIIERTAGPGLLGPVYCGPVTQPQADYDSRTLTVTCGTLFDWWLTERIITDDLTYTAKEQTQLCADLLTRYSTGLGPAGDVRVGMQTLTTGRKLTQAYLRTDQKTVGQAVKDIATARNGFDFTIDLTRQQDNRLIRTWRPHSPEMGRQIETPLMEGRGGLRAFSLEKASDVATRVFGVGQANTTTTATTTAATSSTVNDSIFSSAQASAAIEARYGVHVKPMQGSDTTTKQVLDSLVREYLSTRTPPVDIVSFQYRVSEARPFGFIGLGDTVRVQANRGWAQYDGWVRVIARAVTVDSNGGELIACTGQGVDGGIA